MIHCVYDIDGGGGGDGDHAGHGAASQGEDIGQPSLPRSLREASV